MLPTDQRKVYLYAQIVGSFLIFVSGVAALIGGKIGQICGYFLYTIVACTFLPLPTTPYVIGMGKIFHPGFIAVVGSVGNCIAAYVEYRGLLWLFSRTELQQKLETFRLYQYFSQFFEKNAFACLLFTGFFAIPFEPFRIAAILIHYPVEKYLLSVLLGRIPRYYLIALIGSVYRIPTQVLIVIGILMMIIPTFSYGIKKYKS